MMSAEQPFLDLGVEAGEAKEAGEAVNAPRGLSQNLLADIKRIYPPRSGGQGWGALIRLLQLAVSKGYTEQELIDGAKSYRRYCDLSGITGTSFVRMAKTFYGPDEWFAEDYEISLPASANPQLTLEAKYDADARRLGEPLRASAESLDQYRERLAVAVRRSLVRAVK